MEPDHAARDAAMARLEAFIGEWVMEAGFPGGAGGGTGRAVFEWALDGQFLICRTAVPGGPPDGLMIMGYDPGRMPYRQHYFDSRGVARVYAMDLSDGVWTLLRDSADFTPAGLRAAVHRHVLRGRPADRRPLGVGPGWRDLGA